ncbi:helix-turn-helix domain-containing protein [Streptomyces colonosanans]|uniref:HTH cro/C1-type domain-containing protein n=1 Tax=Streptomyces colonosanans TaxID=1428652 RepID=A0A1S2P4B4_9ACTN|nr:helix-turn-helix transcriptional regulator [Streptomyces colonosanans]OIJ88491.1 hypothetical protein BIV24_21575 [Streptomyces colonosanans]
MNFQTGPIRDASRIGDYGRVIELARKAQQMTQTALGQALGLSQSAVSRLEKKGQGDSGSARSWYGGAIKAARAAGKSLLTAYQTGTLAQFEAHAGNGTEALNLTHRARRAIGERRPAVADAWLASVEALAHAAIGDQRAADRALTASRKAAETLTTAEEPPPWPWVFSFTPAKVAACRVNCGALLRLPEWAISDDVEALSTGHSKQRALLVLDIAAGYLFAGRVEAAFALASRALDTGLEYRSGRIVERARTVRRTLTTATPPKVVRDFDERLHGVCL